MLRALFFIIKLSLLAGVIVWVSGQEGSVTLVWREYEFVLDLAAFALVTFGLAVLMTAVYQLYRWIVNLPKAWARYQERKHYHDGMQSLTRGLTAVAAGDARVARQMASRARRKLPVESGLTLFLEAQAARLSGKDEEARRILGALVEDPDAGFLGVRGLLQHALEHDDARTAHRLVDQALQSRDKHPWLLQVAYSLALKAQDWPSAMTLLDKLAKFDVLSAEDVLSDRVTLLIARSDALMEDGEPKRAKALLKKAQWLDPYFVPLISRLVLFYLEDDKRRKARGVLSKAWKENPHPQLALLWGRLIAPAKAKKPLERVKWYEKLKDMQPGAAESYVALGQVALEEGLWGEAREYLHRADDLSLAPDARIYTALAALERQQGQDEDAAQQWLIKAREAGTPPMWVCVQSGRSYAVWAPVADPHGTFNSMRWGAVPDMPLEPAFAVDRLAGMIGG